MTTTRRTFLRSGLVAGLGVLAHLRSSSSTRAADSPPSPLRVGGVIAEDSAKAPLSLLFRGTTEEQCRQWQKQFRAKLAELLGDTKPPKHWQAEQESRREFDDHIRYELLLKADSVPTVPVYLLLPKRASEQYPVPGVLCVHGHGSYGHHPVVGRTDLEGVAKNIQTARYDYGLQFVRRGYAVVAPCLIPFGRRLDRAAYGRTDPCAITFVRMQALGQLPIAANLRDLRWSIDLLQSRPEVKQDNIGCAGLSYGGRMTMLVSAVDRRVKVACISGALNLLQERITHRYSCGSQIIPGLLRFGDYSEIGSLIAPRAAVWEVGAQDGLITPSWAELFRRRLERAYKAYGALAKLRFDHYDGGHRWNGQIAYPLFDQVLKA